MPSDYPLWLAQSYSNEQYREEGDHLYKVRLVSAVIRIGKSDYKNKLQGQSDIDYQIHVLCLFTCYNTI